MLLALTIRNLKVTKMLLDGGSSLNLMSTNILKKLKLSQADLREIGTFQRVNPGKTKPKGQITLPVKFGTPINFRIEKIIFDVGDILVSYNGILGSPALAKFSAASRYAYSTLKMPGPEGIITIRTDMKDVAMCLEKMYKDLVATTTCILETLAVSKASRNDCNQSAPEGGDKASGNHNSQRRSGSWQARRCVCFQEGQPFVDAEVNEVGNWSSHQKGHCQGIWVWCLHQRHHPL